MTLSINRKRLACAECTRRKVRCDKTIPCHNCIARNISCSRVRAARFPFYASPSDSATCLVESAARRTSSSNQVLSLVETLQARVNALELVLQQANLSQPSSGEIVQPHTLLPRTNSHQREQFYNGATPPEQMSSEIEDAATILEFLAWGRRKQSKYHNQFITRGQITQQSPGLVDEEDHGPFFSSKASLRSYLETLLPNRSQISNLVKYHCDCLLWYHGSFHSLVFWRDLEDFYQQDGGNIDNPSVDLQWSFDTDKPRNCNEDDMKALPDDIPTPTSYSRFFYDIAALMPRVQDAIASSNTAFTSYEKILEYDQQMRYLATVRLPRYLQNVPIEQDWPCYVPWARRCLAISSSHKIIMIHRKFLALSFTNPIFSRTRRTCVAAARTIIKEQKEAAVDDGPTLWIHHAFSVAAGIILCLDLIHSPPTAPECEEHRQLRTRENALGQNGSHVDFASRESSRNSSLYITETIQNFCEQEHLYFQEKHSGVNMSNNQNEINEFSWTPSISDCGTFLTPGARLSTHPPEVPHGFEDIFALATNYINFE
ncbi:Putative transcriptional regulatory protein C16G5,16 [Talaromyces islandicus]|uniref:Putative transcriptional regulatory protein C16G5,16 n=1 Tax=Talaromyces islandicus TaxID=28573 RepID=A0A0U1LKS6_TALIS|nr:Putative transcriptional regulatory protein C16G5,16 [Talaromyces islandicus]